MKRVLITGMSGTGKSSLIHELVARGYKGVDADYGGFSESQPLDEDQRLEQESAGPDSAVEHEQLWREDRIQDLLSTEDAEVLFLSGCVRNQGKFYPQFDHIVLLTAPADVIVERLMTRTNNPYGKHPEQVAETLHFQKTVEPLLRRSASLVVDTTVPLAEVAATVLQHVQPENE